VPVSFFCGREVLKILNAVRDGHYQEGQDDVADLTQMERSIKDDAHKAA